MRSEIKLMHPYNLFDAKYSVSLLCIVRIFILIFFITIIIIIIIIILVGS